MSAFLRQNHVLQGLILGLAQVLISYLSTQIMCAGYLFLRFKDGREICQINPSQTLMNLQCHVFRVSELT